MESPRAGDLVAEAATSSDRLQAVIDSEVSANDPLLEGIARIAGDSNPLGDAFSLFSYYPSSREGFTAGVGVSERASRRKIAPPLGVS